MATQDSLSMHKLALEPLELIQMIQLSHCPPSDRVSLHRKSYPCVGVLLVPHYLGVLCDELSGAEGHARAEVKI